MWLTPGLRRRSEGGGDALLLVVAFSDYLYNKASGQSLIAAFDGISVVYDSQSPFHFGSLGGLMIPKFGHHPRSTTSHPSDLDSPVSNVPIRGETFLPVCPPVPSIRILRQKAGRRVGLVHAHLLGCFLYISTLEV